jgi:hypothetical protein
MTNALAINRLVNVQVNLSPLAAQMQNISTLLILGSTGGVIDTVERFRSYTGLDGVAADFGTTASEYYAANLWFQQAPQPVSLQIGRWAKTDTYGKLLGATLSAAQQLLATWTAITTGAFKVTVDGVLKTLASLDFHLQTNLNGVASVIQTALAGSATCVWNATYNRFEFTSTTSGASSTVSFLTAPASGVDISAMLGGLSTSSGAYAANGVVAETALAAVTLFDQNYGQNWYGLTVLGAADADHLAIAPYIEGATSKHVYGVSTQAAGTISAVSTTDIAYQLRQLAYKRTVVQYSSSNAYAVCSLLGRILTTDYNGNNTVITLMYKQEPGIAAETLNVSQITALEAKGCNVFVAYNNSTAIIEPGVVSSGDFLDVITGTDWLALSIQTSVYNLLYTTTTKIPQTDQGNQLIVTTIEAECSRAGRNGLLAPGVWQAGGFGALQQNDFLPKGFYVFAPPIAQQNPADRAARKSVPIQIAAKLAGAIHSVDVIINVNR